MTFLEVEYPDEAAAKDGLRALTDRLKATGEWHLRPERERWRLSVVLESDLTARQQALLGGEVVGPAGEALSGGGASAQTEGEGADADGGEDAGEGGTGDGPADGVGA